MMLFYRVLYLFALAPFAYANTEAFYFKAVQVQSEGSPGFQVINSDRVNKIEIDLNPPVQNESLIQWFEIQGLDQGNVYNARISWTALDPIDVIHFDFEPSVMNGTTVTNGNFLRLETKYNCFTKDKEFMNSSHRVDGVIVVSSTIGYIPSDLKGNVILIFSTILGSVSLYSVLLNWLKRVK